MCVCLVGAKWSRDILTRVLCESYDNGDLTLEEAVGAAHLILNRNALEFYKLEGARTGIQRTLSTESLMRLQESLAPSLTVEKPPTFEFRLLAAVPKPAHPNGSTLETNPTPRFTKPEEPTQRPAEVKAVAAAPVAVIPRVAGTVNAVAVDAKPIEVKHVRLMFVDSSGLLRCRVRFPHQLSIVHLLNSVPAEI